MRSRAIDDRRGICRAVLYFGKAFHLVMVYQVDIRRRISQRRLLEEEMRWVGVHSGEASTIPVVLISAWMASFDAFNAVSMACSRNSPEFSGVGIIKTEIV